MPGISMLFDIKKLDSSKVAATLDTLKHETNYKVNNIYKTDNFSAAFTGYEGYPRQSFEVEDAVCFMEGIIYNEDDNKINNRLQDITRAYQKGGDFKKLIGEFVADADGDFNILIYFKKTNELLVFDDRWGRLPVYYFGNDNLLVLSRELKFVLDFVPYIEIVKTSLADFLVFQQTLGENTLFNDIFRLGPSGILTLKKNNRHLVVNRESSLEVNFTQSKKTISEKECVKRCRDLFLEGMKNRVNKLEKLGYKITADLSGGYDTRAILGSLKNINAKVDYYTDPIRSYESKYVDAIAAQFNLKPIKIQPDKDINMSMANIAFLTNAGMDAKTALERYQTGLTRARTIKGKAAKFTGLEGEVLRIVYKNVLGYKSMSEMVKDNIFSTCGLPMEHVCELLNLDKTSYYDYLTRYFATTYPEATLRDKSKHLYFDFTSHVDIAGEDRHRLHFWTVPPFWNKDLFTFAMIEIPGKYIGYGFNRKFIKTLYPDILKVPIYIYYIDLDAKFKVYRSFVALNLRNAAKRLLRLNKNLFQLAVKLDAFLKDRQDKTLTTQNTYEKVRKDIMASYNNLKAFSSLFNGKTLSTSKDRNQTRLFLLLTSILYCSEIERRYKAKIKL